MIREWSPKAGIRVEKVILFKDQDSFRPALRKPVGCRGANGSGTDYNV